MAKVTAEDVKNYSNRKFSDTVKPSTSTGVKKVTADDVRSYNNNKYNKPTEVDYKSLGYQTRDAYDADSRKYTWALQNQGMSYDEVKRRKLSATGDELDYLNQYGTLVGYNNVADYDAELEDIGEPSKLQKYGAMAAKGAISGIAGAIATIPSGVIGGGKTAKFVYNKLGEYIDDGSDSYYTQLEQKRNLAKSQDDYDKYSSIKDREDFEQNSYAVDNADKRINRKAADSEMVVPWEMASLATMLTGNVPFAIATGLVAKYYNDQDKVNLMTDDEIKTYYYLYNTQGEAEASKYLDEISLTLDKRNTEGLRQSISEVNNQELGGLTNTARRVIFQPMANATSLANIGYGIYNDITGNGSYNPYSDLALYKNYTDFAEQTTGQYLNDAFGNPQVLGVDVPSFLYSTALSSADSYIGAETSGKYYSVVMGTGAFQSTARDLADSGASEEEIWVKASASGIAEIVTEYYSLEQLEGIMNDSNLDSKRKVLMAALRQSGYEGSEEVAADIINHIVDEMYMGRASEMKQKVEEYIEQGYTKEEAERKVKQEFCIQLGESFLGGALSGGGAAIVGGASQYNANKAQGAELRENQNLQALDETAQSIDHDSDAYKNYARITGTDGKIENATDAQIGSAYRSIGNQLAEEIKASNSTDIENLLVMRGMDVESAKVASKAVYSLLTNGNTKGLSRAEISSLSDDRVSNLVNGIIEGRISITESEQTKNLNKASESFKRASQMRTIIQDATRIEQTETGYRITNADGTTNVVHNESVTDSEREIMERISKYNESAQDIFIRDYAKSGNIDLYDNAFSIVYDRGRNGEETFTDSEVRKYGEILGISNMMDIYKAGNMSAKEDAVKTAEQIDKILNGFKAENIKGGNFKYKGVRIDGKTYTINPDNLPYKKKQLFKFAQALSALGINVELIDDKSAKALNGQFNPDTNSITINLSATFDGKNIKRLSQKYVLSTFAHELTHYLEYNANDAYIVLRNLIKEGLMNKHEGSVSVWDKQFNFEYNEAIKNGQKHDEAVKTAESEVIARACEDVLSNNQQMVDILSQADTNVLTEIRNAVKEFFEKFRGMVEKLLGTYRSDAAEAKAIREIDGLLKDVQKAWADAFTQAIAISQMTEEQRAQVVKAEETTGVETDEDTASSDLNSAKRILANEWESLGYKSYEDCIDDVANDINEKAHIGDLEKVKRWIKAEESIAALIMREQNRKYLDYEADDRYEAIKKNSDYKQGTFDLSNLCRKREIFTKMFDALQRENPDILFDADDIATIRQVLVDSHYEVACALCYVEDRRQNMGEIADAFIGFYKAALDSDSKLLFKYVPGKGGEVKKTGLYPTKAQVKKYGISSSQYKATDKYVPTQYDLVTYEGLKNLQKNHPTIAYAFERYNNSRGQQSARVIEGHAEYKREVLKYTDAMVKKANDLGGLRVFSFSDFEAIHLIDVCQIIVDCAKMGVKIQTYTKVPEFASLVRNTGIKLNRSLIPANVGSENAYARVMVDGKQKFVKVKPYANGIAKYKGKDVLAFDNVEGIDVTSKYFLDETDNPNIGNILIGMSKAQIELAMEDPFIDYIIPFHTGQKLSVLHAKGIAEWKNFKDVQLDKKLPGSTSTKKEINIYEVIEKYHPTNKYEFTEAFLKECGEQKFKPRFDEFISRDADGNYQYTEGYWKMLLDFKMFDAEGNILLQENIRPDIDESLAKKILNEGKKREEQIRFDDDIVNEVKKALADKHTLKSQKRDANNNPVTLNGDSFWSGSVNVSDGKIEEIHSYEQAENANFHHSLYFSLEQIEKMDAEECAFFCVNKLSNPNSVAIDDIDVWRDDISDEIKREIVRQIKPNTASKNRYSQKRDSEGTKLSDAQVEYFKDSKVRDKDGKLIPLFHGTSNGGFNVFSQAQGVGYWFTDSAMVATTYSDAYADEIYSPSNDEFSDVRNMLINQNEEWGVEADLIKEGNKYIVIENGDRFEYGSLNEVIDNHINSRNTDNINYKCYLNITNPYIIDAKGRMWNDLPSNDGKSQKMVVDVSENGLKFSFDGKTKTIGFEWGEFSNYLKSLGISNDRIMDMYDVLGNVEFGKSHTFDIATKNEELTNFTTRDYEKFAHEHGYDGLIVLNVIDPGYAAEGSDWNRSSNVFVAFNSDQIKSVNNTNPTHDPDIRYSTKRDSEYLDAVNNGDIETADRLVREEAIANGYYSPIVYHGTHNFGETKLRDGYGANFFNSSSKVVARTYANGSSMNGVRDVIGNVKENRRNNISITESDKLLDFVNEHKELFEEHQLRFYESLKYADEDLRKEYKVKKSTKYAYVGNDFFGRKIKFEDWELRSRIKHELNKNGAKEVYRGMYSSYINTDGYAVIDCGGKAWNAITPSKIRKALGATEEEIVKGNHYTTDDICDIAFEKGFRGIIFKNIYDVSYGINEGENPVADDYVSFYPSSDMKSADTVTYDDEGNIIPLSERFNPKNNDIRYSTKRTTEQKLTAENEKLKEDVKSLRELVRLQGRETNGTIPTKSSIEAASKSILKSAHSTYSRAELEKELANLWKKLDRNGDRQVSTDKVYDDIRTIAENVADKITDQVEIDKEYKKILNDIRHTRFSLTSKQMEIAKAKYGTRYRDNFMGKVILDKNARSLDLMWEDWMQQYPEVFTEMLEEDMVDGFLDAYESIRDASQYVVELDSELAVNEIMQTITEKMWNIASYQTVADKYANKIKEMKAKHRKEMDALKKARAEQKLADEMHYKRILQKMREERDAKINDIKENAKKRKETDRQRAEKKALLKKIDKISKKLREKLTVDSSKNSVPNDLKVPVINLLNALDFSSEQLLGIRGGENAYKPTKRDLSIQAAMAKLNEQVAKSVQAQADGGFVMDIPGDYAQTVAEINSKVAQIQSEVGNSVYVLQEMDNQTLEDIADMLTVMLSSVNQMNAMIASRNKHSVDKIAQDIIKESQAKGKRKNSSLGALNTVDDFINKLQITPYYFFKHLGDGGMQVFQELQDGFDKYAFHIVSINNFAKENWTGKQVKEWTKTINSFDIQKAPTLTQVENGESGDVVHIEMTIPQIMSLYCLNKRQQARNHIYKKGIKIAEFKNGAMTSGETKTTLTEENVQEIISVLTDEQIKVADAIQNHMNTVCKNWMNEITMKRFGIIGALEENYFPIKTDDNSHSVGTNDSNAQSIYRLLNLSFTKKLNDLANNEIMVGDIFTVFTDHATDMAKYNAIALPTLDLIKVLNYNESEKTEGSQIESLRLRDTLDTAYGKRCVQYINKMLTDLNGSARNESGNKLLTTLARNYKIAQVGANIQVALLQPLSIIRASYVLDPQYIARGLARRPQVRRVQQECGISAWKQLGFFQINVNRGLEHMIRQDDTVYDRITDASMRGAEVMDNLTWGYIYNACEEWARANTSYATDSKEFRQEVNDKFREVVYATQVVDSTLTRSDFMRSNSEINKAASAFMAEPTLTYNMVYDAFNGFVSDIRKGASRGQALRNNGRKIARAVATFAISAGIESALRGAISLVREPDKEEEYWKRVLEYFLNELNPLSKIPIAKDILSILQGYSVTRMEYGGISNAYTAYKSIVKDIDNGALSYKTVYKIVTAVSQLSGVAASGMMRDVVSLWNSFCRLFGWDSLIIGD